jgi:GNAT superfamily N-acetyltransferase
MAMVERAQDTEFRARVAGPEDTPGMLRVLQEAFPQWPPIETGSSALDHLEWKISPPDADQGCQYVVERDGEVVAVKLTWIGRARLEGEEYVTDNGADVAVAPAFQGQGIGRLLAQFEEEGQFRRGDIAVEPLPQSAAMLHMRYPSADLPALVLERPLSWRARVSVHWRSRNPGATVRAVVAAARGRLRRGRPVGPQVAGLERFDERTDALWVAVREQYDYARSRDAAYLNWRFADPRGGARTLFGVFEGDEALAWAAVQPSEGALQVSDAVVHPDHPEAGMAVLERAVLLGRMRGADRVVAWLAPDDPDRRLYEAVGFVPTESVTIAHHLPRGKKEPDLVPRFQRPGLRRRVALGDFDFA